MHKIGCNIIITWKLFTNIEKIKTKQNKTKTLLAMSLCLVHFTPFFLVNNWIYRSTRFWIFNNSFNVVHGLAELSFFFFFFYNYWSYCHSTSFWMFKHNYLLYFLFLYATTKHFHYLLYVLLTFGNLLFICNPGCGVTFATYVNMWSMNITYFKKQLFQFIPNIINTSILFNNITKYVFQIISEGNFTEISERSCFNNLRFVQWCHLFLNNIH